MGLVQVTNAAGVRVTRGMDYRLQPDASLAGSNPVVLVDEIVDCADGVWARLRVPGGVVFRPVDLLESLTSERTIDLAYSGEVGEAERFRVLREGKVSKGGQNGPPKTRRPGPPRGQGPRR